MAILPFDDKQKITDPNAQADAGAQTGALSGISSGAPTAGGGGGQGTGGLTLGGFTPIQDYLLANSGETGSADVLQKKVGDSFGADKQAYEQGSAQAKSQAQEQVSKNYIGQDAASKMIEQAGSLYNQGGQAYDANVAKARGALGATYQGPESYNYGLSDQSQRYGTDLSDDGGFDTLMRGVYRESSGGHIGSGGIALQKQIDSTNDRLGSTRTQLKGDYANLNSGLEAALKDTGSAIQGAKADVVKNRGDLQSYLDSQSTSRNKSLQDSAKAANDAAQAAFVSGKNNFLASTPTITPGYTSLVGTRGDYANITNEQHPELTVENQAGLAGGRHEFNAIQDYLQSLTPKYADQDAKSLDDYGFDYTSTKPFEQRVIGSMPANPELGSDYANQRIPIVTGNTDPGGHESIKNWLIGQAAQQASDQGILAAPASAPKSAGSVTHPAAPGGTAPSTSAPSAPGRPRFDDAGNFLGFG